MDSTRAFGDVGVGEAVLELTGLVELLTLKRAAFFSPSCGAVLPSGYCDPTLELLPLMTTL